MEISPLGLLTMNARSIGLASPDIPLNFAHGLGLDEEMLESLYYTRAKPKGHTPMLAVVPPTQWDDQDDGETKGGLIANMDSGRDREG